MSVSEDGEIHDYCVWMITTVENAGEVEEFCSFVYFCFRGVFFAVLSVAEYL